MNREEISIETMKHRGNFLITEIFSKIWKESRISSKDIGAVSASEAVGLKAHLLKAFGENRGRLYIKINDGTGIITSLTIRANAAFKEFEDKLRTEHGIEILNILEGHPDFEFRIREIPQEELVP
jgi:hypothetical protein